MLLRGDALVGNSDGGQAWRRRWLSLNMFLRASRWYQTLKLRNQHKFLSILLCIISKASAKSSCCKPLKTGASMLLLLHENTHSKSLNNKKVWSFLDQCLDNIDSFSLPTFVLKWDTPTARSHTCPTAKISAWNQFTVNKLFQKGNKTFKEEFPLLNKGMTLCCFCCI